MITALECYVISVLRYGGENWMKRKFDDTEMFIKKNNLKLDTEKRLVIRIRKKVGISRTQHEKNKAWKF